MELGFLLDVNADHLSPENFVNVLNSVKSTYAPFTISQDKTRVGIVTYGGRPQTAVSLDQYISRQALDTAVGQVPMSSGPSVLGQGLAAVIRQLFQGKTRPEIPKILVLVTGGKSVDDVVKPAAELKEINTTIFCVGVGNKVERKQLDVVATFPSTNHVIMASISHRETAGGNLASRINKGGYQHPSPALEWYQHNSGVRRTFDDSKHSNTTAKPSLLDLL